MAHITAFLFALLRAIEPEKSLSESLARIHAIGDVLLDSPFQMESELFIQFLLNTVTTEDRPHA
ncbi:MAG: hypothetical protein ABSG03_27045 [Bryobacteraceae bacterium]|jgi:hypothetical protein